jgi:ribosomal protein L11 methyltransferase
MPWRALTLRVEASAAEAMSEALLEAGAQSVAIEMPEAPRPTLCALLELERDPLELVRAASQAAGLATPNFTTTELEDEDWVRRSQAQFAPIEVGERLWVGPSWHAPPAGRVAVRLDPGLAFGTGSHPSTRLVLDFLEQHIRGGERVLDYGCGSGILAIAAAKLGAAHVAAVDLDAQAVATALANAGQNGIALDAGMPESLPAALYDVVVSNILAQPLIVLAPLLAARSARGGRIALAGILEREAEEVAAAYAPWFDARADRAREGWSLVTGTRR